MRLLLDLRWVRSEMLDGIARVSLSVTAALLEEKPEWQYLFLFENQDLKAFCLHWFKEHLKKKLKANYTAIEVGYSAQSIRNRFSLWKKVKHFQPDLYLSYYYIFHPLPLPQIGIVHDLIPLIYPEYFHQASIQFKLLMTHKIMLRWLIRQASHTLTVSNSTRQDLINRLGLKASDISVISLGVGLTGSEKVLGLKPGYILTVGRPDPHKNFAGLIRAYAQIPKTQQKKHTLVLAGPQDPRYTPHLKQLVAQLKLTQDVIFTGSIPAKALPQLYQNAALFALPSLYEGFGLPIIEAMSYGIPVLTSNQGSMPEVSAHAALLINPTKPEAIAQGLTELLNHPELANQLAQRGRIRAQAFSWQKTAREVAQIVHTQIKKN